MAGLAWLRQQAPLLAAALWWGSLTTIGFLAVPLLFAQLPSPTLAGHMAARLFAAQTWVSVGCCLVWLVLSLPKNGIPSASPGGSAMILILGGMLLALLLQFGVAPRIVARDNLALWHKVGSAMYVLQWLCALGLLLRGRQDQRQDQPQDQAPG
ncbi:hypothetical protein MASR1M59_16270 [Melaminivora sp.]